MQGGHLTRAGLAILLFASPAAANERFPTADDRSEVPLVYSIAGGFVFVDGVYVEAPYDVTLSADGESILINDHRIGAVSSFGAVERAWGRRSGGGRLSSGPGVRRGRRPGGPERGARFGPASRIRGVLDGQNGSVVATTGDPPIYLNYDQTTSLLSLLNDTRQSSEQTQELLADLPDEAGLDWELWLHDFISSEEFRQRRDEVLQAVAVDEAAQQSAIAAVRRFETYAYPLTVLGMLLGAIAFGHLLISLPSRAEFGGDSSAAAEIVRATVISLGLVVALSSLDLIWTLLASQSGQMRELNPLASRLISDPEALVAFKVVATLLGCGVLFALRRHSRAQLASWWMCLVCTMLTFRWLMFNSMFIA